MAKDGNIAFASNWTNLFMIDITPGGPSRTFARIGAGINSADPIGDDEVSEEAYYDGEGGSDSEVTGRSSGMSFSGHRCYGDPAQDYIESIEEEAGEARKTTFRMVGPNGRIKEGPATITNIKTFGGGPKDKSEFSCDIKFNGRPKVTPGNAKEFPETVTATAVSVAVGATAEVAATVAPSGASTACVYGIEDSEIATVDAMGVVTGVKTGKTKLSVKSAVKPSVTAEVEVTVTAAANAASAK